MGIGRYSAAGIGRCGAAEGGSDNSESEGIPDVIRIDMRFGIGPEISIEIDYRLAFELIREKLWDHMTMSQGKFINAIFGAKDEGDIRKVFSDYIRMWDNKSRGEFTKRHKIKIRDHMENEDIFEAFYDKSVGSFIFSINNLFMGHLSGGKKNPIKVRRKMATAGEIIKEFIKCAEVLGRRGIYYGI